MVGPCSALRADGGPGVRNGYLVRAAAGPDQPEAFGAELFRLIFAGRTRREELDRALGALARAPDDKAARDAFDGLISEADFKEFMFWNPVELHAGVNPDFGARWEESRNRSRARKEAGSAASGPGSMAHCSYCSYMFVHGQVCYG